MAPHLAATLGLIVAVSGLLLSLPQLNVGEAVDSRAEEKAPPISAAERASHHMVGGLRRTGFPAFEPTLGSDPEGRIFYGAMYVHNRILRSDDSGSNWTEKSPTLAQRSYPDFTLDPYVHVDPTTGRVFSVDLSGECLSLAFTDDAGESWTIQPLACGIGASHDHQTLWTSRPRTLTTVGYPNLVHYCVNSLTHAACSRSLDGGLTWMPLTPVFLGVEPSTPAQPVCLGGHGHGIAAADGTLYLPSARCGVPTVWISQDDGVTWETIVIATAPLTPQAHLTLELEQFLPVRDHEIGFDVDGAGNAYAMWIGGDDLLPYLAVSPDGGRSWRAPVSIAPKDVRTTAFPALAAGDEGRLVAAYYGTTSDKPFGQMTADDTWNGYLTIVAGATTKRPKTETVAVNAPSDPLARGVCGGGRCPNDRGVGDFIDVQIDGAGRPWAAFVDVCHERCMRGGPFDGNEGVLGTLLTGPRLRGDGMLEPLAPHREAGAPADHETFGQAGRLRGYAKILYIGDPANGPPLAVHEGATAMLFEARWSSPASDLWIELWGTDGPAMFVAARDETDPGTHVRAVTTDPAHLQPGRYQTMIRARAVDEPYELAVTVFYDGEPAGFTGFGPSTTWTSHPERQQVGQDGHLGP